MAKRKFSKWKIGSLFVVTFVLGFGFLSGLWINLGFNPKEEILKFFVEIVFSLFPTTINSFLFWLIPIVLSLLSLFTAFKKGGLLGIMAVAMAFSAGLAIPALSAVILLGIAMVAGFVSPFVKRNVF